MLALTCGVCNGGLRANFPVMFGDGRRFTVRAYCVSSRWVFVAVLLIHWASGISLTHGTFSQN